MATIMTGIFNVINWLIFYTPVYIISNAITWIRIAWEDGKNGWMNG